MVLPLPVASRQVGRLAPFQRFRRRSHVLNGGGGLKDQISDFEKPRARTCSGNADKVAATSAVMGGRRSLFMASSSLCET